MREKTSKRVVVFILAITMSLHAGLASAEATLDLTYNSAACRNSSFSLPSDAHGVAEGGESTHCPGPNSGLAMLGNYRDRSLSSLDLVKEDVAHDVRARLLSNLEVNLKMRANAKALESLGINGQVDTSTISDVIRQCGQNRNGMTSLEKEATQLFAPLLRAKRGDQIGSDPAPPMSKDAYVKRFIIAMNEDTRIRGILLAAKGAHKPVTRDLHLLYLRLQKIRKEYPAVELMEDRQVGYDPSQTQLYPEVDGILFGDGPLPSAISTSDPSRFSELVNTVLSKPVTSGQINIVKELVFESTQQAEKGVAAVCTETDPCRIFGAALSTSERLVGSMSAKDRIPLASAICSCKIGEQTNGASKLTEGVGLIALGSGMLAGGVCALTVVMEPACPVVAAAVAGGGSAALTYDSGVVAWGAIQDYMKSYRETSIASGVGNSDDQEGTAARRADAGSRVLAASAQTVASAAGTAVTGAAAIGKAAKLGEVAAGDGAASQPAAAAKSASDKPSFFRRVVQQVRNDSGPFEGYGDYLATHSKEELNALRASDPAFAAKMDAGQVVYRDGRWLLKMDKNHLGENYKPLPINKGRIVSYLDDEQKAMLRVKIKRGRILTSDGRPFPQGGADAVIDEQGNLYVFNSSATSKFEEGLNLHHSSFSAGGPVQAAFRISFDKYGVVRVLGPNSGHYLSSDFFMSQTGKLLRDMSVDLRQAKTTSLADYLESLR